MRRARGIRRGDTARRRGGGSRRGDTRATWRGHGTTCSARYRRRGRRPRRIGRRRGWRSCCSAVQCLVAGDRRFWRLVRRRGRPGRVRCIEPLWSCGVASALVGGGPRWRRLAAATAPPGDGRRQLRRRRRPRPGSEPPRWVASLALIAAGGLIAVVLVLRGRRAARHRTGGRHRRWGIAALLRWHDVGIRPCGTRSTRPAWPRQRSPLASSSSADHLNASVRAADVVRDGGPTRFASRFASGSRGVRARVRRAVLAGSWRATVVLTLKSGADALVGTRRAIPEFTSGGPLRDGLELLAAHRRALDDLDARTADVVASTRRIADADQLAAAGISIELDRMVAGHLEASIAALERSALPAAHDATRRLDELLGEIALANGLRPALRRTAQHRAACPRRRPADASRDRR